MHISPIRSVVFPENLQGCQALAATRVSLASLTSKRNDRRLENDATLSLSLSLSFYFSLSETIYSRITYHRSMRTFATEQIGTRIDRFETTDKGKNTTIRISFFFFFCRREAIFENLISFKPTPVTLFDFGIVHICMYHLCCSHEYSENIDCRDAGYAIGFS